MKIIAFASVTAGGKTTIVNELKKKLPKVQSLHFDDYTFEGEVDDFYNWVMQGADYNVWDLTPLENDILGIIDNGSCDYLLLDYPFAYCNNLISKYIDCAIFIDTPLDIAMARRVLRDMKDVTGNEIRKDMEQYWEIGAGGSALKGEEKIQTVLREVQEETGIDEGDLKELYCIVHERHQSIYYGYLLVTSYEKDKIKLQEGETIDYKWVSKEELLEFYYGTQCAPNTKVRLKEFIDSIDSIR